MNSEGFDKENSEEKIPNSKNKSQSFFSEVFKFVLLALLIVIPIRAFIAQPFLVTGSSMDPTFKNADYLIIDEISYRFNEPKRGEVIVFKFPKNPSKFFIKRIIGLPGETVNIVEGEVFVDTGEDNNGPGIKIEEDYVANKGSGNLSLTLEKEEYFVMGDNRMASLDSRNWGALPKNLIRGRALLRLLPINKLGVFPGFAN